MTRLLGTFGTSPVWSPDGKRIVFEDCSPGEQCSLFSKTADGSGATERISPPTPEEPVPGSWTAKSNLLVFEQDLLDDRGEQHADIHVLPMDGQQKPKPWATTPSVEELAPRLSPDERWVAYTAYPRGVFVALPTMTCSPMVRRS